MGNFSRNILLLLAMFALAGCVEKEVAQEIEANKAIAEEAFVEIEAMQTQTQTSVTQELNITKYVAAAPGLRVRSAPNLEAERLGVLANESAVRVIRESGSFVTIDGVRGQWVFVRADDLEGWVFDGYLSEQRFGEIAGTFNTMEEVEKYFENYFNFEKMRSAKSLDELTKAFGHLSENKRVTTRNITMVWGNVVEQTYIEDDPYTLLVFERTQLENITVRLMENNFLDLFPYQTLQEYLASGNFGSSTNTWEDITSLSRYSSGTQWVLRFKNAVLYEVAYFVDRS
jgi:hypothetical protein